MKKTINILLVILIFIYIIYSILDYKSTRGIDDLAYALAIGIDKGSSSSFKISFQFTKPSSENNPVSSSSSASSFIYSVESNTIPSRY